MVPSLRFGIRENYKVPCSSMKNDSHSSRITNNFLMAMGLEITSIRQKDRFFTISWECDGIESESGGGDYEIRPAPSKKIILTNTGKRAAIDVGSPQ